jgi:hypothetical protein
MTARLCPNSCRRTRGRVRFWEVRRMLNLKVLVCATILAIGMGILGVAPLQAQSVDDLVAKYVEALGGENVLSSIRSIYLEGTTQTMGIDAPVISYLVVGKGLRVESEFNGIKLVTCFTPQGGWAINPMGGGNAERMTDEQVKSSREDLQIGGYLFNYVDKGNKVELIGRDGSGGSTVYRLKITPKEGMETDYYIDAVTYHLIRTVQKGQMQGQDVEVTNTFSDYRKTDIGYVIAYSRAVDFGGNFSAATTYRKVEINKAIDPAIFDMPR